MSPMTKRQKGHKRTSLISQAPSSSTNRSEISALERFFKKKAQPNSQSQSDHNPAATAKEDKGQNKEDQ